jgi:hypothetical protein
MAALSSVRAHYASTILRYASMFVAHVCFQMDNGEYPMIFPFPDLSVNDSVNDVALYLCSEWWHSVGWLDYSYDITSRVESLA